MEIILFRLLITYYTRNCFPSRLQGTLLHKRDVHHDQNKFQQSIQQQQLIFMSHCEYSDVTLVVDWILFVSSLEFTLPFFSNFPNFSNNLIKNGKYISCASLWHAQHCQTSGRRKSFIMIIDDFLYITLIAFKVLGCKYTLSHSYFTSNFPLFQRNLHHDHYRFQSCGYSILFFVPSLELTLPVVFFFQVKFLHK